MMSIAKSALQKAHGRANVQILKSRVGDDGLAFEDAMFDNKRMFIDISDKPFKITEEERLSLREEFKSDSLDTEESFKLLQQQFGVAERNNEQLRNELLDINNVENNLNETPQPRISEAVIKNNNSDSFDFELLKDLNLS